MKKRQKIIDFRYFLFFFCNFPNTYTSPSVQRLTCRLDLYLSTNEFKSDMGFSYGYVDFAI